MTKQSHQQNVFDNRDRVLKQKDANELAAMTPLLLLFIITSLCFFCFYCSSYGVKAFKPCCKVVLINKCQETADNAVLKRFKLRNYMTAEC